MDTEGMKCNRCAQPFGDMSQMGVTTCKHVYCLSCVRGLIQTGEGCVACGNHLTKNDVKVLIHHRDPGDAMHLLCGQSTEFIMNSCAAAFDLRREQERVEIMRTSEQTLQQKDQDFARFEDAVREKLTQIHGAYKRYKRKCVDLTEENATMIKDRNELQDKYAQKTAHARRLQEMCETLQSENQKLRRVQGAPHFDARQQRPQSRSQRRHGNTSQGSRGGHPHPPSARDMVATSSRKRPAALPPRKAPAARCSSDISSFHGDPRDAGGRPPPHFRASKKRLLAAGQHAPSRGQPGGAGRDPWRVNKHGAFFDADQGGLRLDPFDVSIRPIDMVEQ